MQKSPAFYILSSLLCALLGLLAAQQCLASLSLTGLESTEKKRVLEHLRAASFICNTAQSSSRSIQQKLDQEVRASLEALGYFNAVWQLARQPELYPGKQCWEVELSITPGEPLRIRSAEIRIEGTAAENTGFLALINKAALVTGSRFNNDRYQNLKRSLQNRALSSGYFDGYFIQQRVDVFPGENVVDISLIWHSGDRYHYGNINIDQQVIDESLFDSLLTIREDQPYHMNQLQQDRLRLGESRYFSTLEIKPLLDQRENNRVPVQVYAAPGKVSSYQAGVGFSTNTGARIRGDYSRHRINRHGHQGEAKALFSKVLSSVNLNYTLPWNNPRTDNLQANLSYIDEDNDIYISKRWESSLVENKTLASGWKQSISLTYSAEQATVAEVDDNSQHLIPAISWSKIIADDPIYPTSGISLSATLLGSTQWLLSDSDFLQVQANVKWIHPLADTLRILARTELGYTLADNLDDLPASRRFFTGGDNSIRGYEYLSLGPDEDGEIVGGRYLTTTSIELEHRITEKWSLAVFLDGGNAWDQGAVDMVAGTGLGLRWRSPVGPLRIDLGIPLEEDADSDFRIHFSIGPDF